MTEQVDFVPCESDVVKSLQDCYDMPAVLTLGELREALKALSKFTQRGPVAPIREVAAAITPIGLGQLSIAAVAALAEAVASVKSDDILEAFTLRELEELLTRLEQV